jgi:predicted RND superfamily exporter protein
MLKAYARWVTGHARLVLALCAALTLAALGQIVDLRTGMPQLQLDTSIEQMLPSGDESRAFYDRARKLFGNDETLLLVVHRPAGIFTTDVLAGVARLSERVESVPGVASVLSLSTAPDIVGVDDELRIAPLFEKPPTDAVELERIERQAFANPLFVGSLVNASGDTTSLVIQLLDISEAEFTRLHPVDILPGWAVRWLGIEPPPPDQRAIDYQIQTLAAEELGPGVETWLVGSARIKAETTRILIDDLLLTIPLAFLLIAFVAALSFRTARGVLLPVSAIGLAVVWTLGVMVAVDPQLNIITISVPMLLIVIGFAYAIHVVSCYYHAVEEGPGAEGSPAERGLHTVLLPTFLTTATTVAGFFSLVTHPLAAIRQFGLYGGIGVGIAGLVAITFVPALLELLRVPAPRAVGRDGAGESTSTVDRLLARLGEFDCRHALPIFGVVIALSVLSGVGIPRIQVNSTMVSNFPEDSAVRRAVQAVNEHLGGAGQLNIVLETDYPNGLHRALDPEAGRGSPALARRTAERDRLHLDPRLHQADPPRLQREPAGGVQDPGLAQPRHAAALLRGLRRDQALRRFAVSDREPARSDHGARLR